VDYGQKGCRLFVPTVLGLTLLLNVAAPAVAQEGAKPVIKPMTEKWRPKDGPYAIPGKDFDDSCMEFGDVVIDIAANRTGHSEEPCDTVKLTETGPDAVTLHMTCTNNDQQTPYKKVMLLKRIDENTILVREAQDGKFTSPGIKYTYCSEEVQRAYKDARRRDQQEKTKQREEEAKTGAKPIKNKWRPRDGVYASRGADFDDRCLRSGDVVIKLSDHSVSSGEATCKIISSDDSADVLALQMTCDRPSGKRIDVWRKLDGPRAVEMPTTETMMLSKIDDNSFNLNETQNGKFLEPGGPVTYCGEEAQRAYGRRKAGDGSHTGR
jgi:hypothetical protein